MLYQNFNCLIYMDSSLGTVFWKVKSHPGRTKIVRTTVEGTRLNLDGVKRVALKVSGVILYKYDKLQFIQLVK